MKDDVTLFSKRKQFDIDLNFESRNLNIFFCDTQYSNVLT